VARARWTCPDFEPIFRRRRRSRILKVTDASRGSPCQARPATSGVRASRILRVADASRGRPCRARLAPVFPHNFRQALPLLCQILTLKPPKCQKCTKEEGFFSVVTSPDLSDCMTAIQESAPQWFSAPHPIRPRAAASMRRIPPHGFCLSIGGGMQNGPGPASRAASAPNNPSRHLFQSKIKNHHSKSIFPCAST
jgi:hypothetical protein